MIRTGLLILLLSLSNLFASEPDFPEPSKFLVINPLKSDISLSEVEKIMINKVMLKICAKQGQYQIAMGDIGQAREAKLPIFNVDLSIIGNEQNMVVSGLLTDEKNKVVLQKMVRPNQSRLQLMRDIEDVMNGLFPTVQSKK